MAGAIVPESRAPWFEHERSIPRSGVNTLIDVCGGAPAPLLGADVVRFWLVPILIFVLVVAVSLAGLRWIRSEHLDALASTSLFQGLSRDRLRTVLRTTHAVAFAPGGVIVREGETGKGFFVITKGTARVTVGEDDRGRLSSGAYFGEVAVIDGGPRSATITAESQVSTLELAPAAFRSLLDKEPAIARSIADRLAKLLPGADAPDESVPPGPPARPSLQELQELSLRLRQVNHPDWVQPATTPRRGLRRLLRSGA